MLIAPVSLVVRYRTDPGGNRVLDWTNSKLIHLDPQRAQMRLPSIVNPTPEWLDQVVARLYCHHCGTTQHLCAADVNNYVMDRNWPNCCNEMMLVFIYPNADRDWSRRVECA
jgi:hypothetical protein